MDFEQNLELELFEYLEYTNKYITSNKTLGAKESVQKVYSFQKHLLIPPQMSNPVIDTIFFVRPPSNRMCSPKILGDELRD